MRQDRIIYIWFNHGLWSHDLSLSCIFENRVLSLWVERFYRIKKAPSIKYINDNKKYYKKVLDLLFKNIDLNKVDKFVVVNPPTWLEEKDFSKKQVKFIYNYKHHYLHWLSAFFLSWFHKSAILSVDWSGYDDQLDAEVMQSISFWDENEINLIENVFLDNKKWLYWIGACYYLHSDFVWMSEGSFMGLSSYWDANKYKDIEIFKYDDWKVYLNDIFIESREFEKWLWMFNSWELTQFHIVKNLMKIYWVKDSDMIDRKTNIEKSIFADIAAKVQLETEKAMVYLANYAYTKTKSENLSLAWWVWLNCVANTKILKETKFKNIFVQPACNDQWISLWAALYWYHIYWGNTNKISLNSYGIWPSYSEGEIKNEIENYDKFLRAKHYKDSNLLTEFVAKQLYDNKVIAWFQWWSEFWARALWFRSILASPKSEEMKNRVNDIKRRERWRPLAPIILEECLEDYFETDFISPYMTFTASVKKDKIDEIPSVVHVDWTARYQTISKDNNEKLYNVISKFAELSSTPVVLNTSFNSAWEPIIENPKQAIEMFLSTDIDYLIIWDNVISKEKIFDEFKFNLNKYKTLELNNFWIKPEKYFKEVYVKLWNILWKTIFDKDKNIKISYTNLFDYYRLEFDYKWDIILLTFWYQNSVNYYFTSILWLSVRQKNPSKYSQELEDILDIAKKNMLANEKSLLHFFDKINNELIDKIK